MPNKILIIATLAAGLTTQAALAQPPNERHKEYLNFIKAQAKQLRGK